MVCWRGVQCAEECPMSKDGVSRYFPSGWSTISKIWDGLCAYTAHHGSPKALCNVPANSHSWQTPAQTPKFMCAKIEGAPFEGMHPLLRCLRACAGVVCVLFACIHVLVHGARFRTH